MKRGEFKRGQKFRVVKPGAHLFGWQPLKGGGFTGWRKPLNVGDVLTCAGLEMTMGDGTTVVQWRGENNEQLAFDCEFRPSRGHILCPTPDASYLEAVT